MNSYRKSTVVLFFAIVSAVVLGMSDLAKAVPVTAYGVPVGAIGSNVTVAACGAAGVGSGCYDAGVHMIDFFIPINDAYGGIYGVDTNPSGFKVGTAVDVASGPFDNADILTMFIRYSPLADPTSLSSSVLEFTFLDLDLGGANDPNGFFESVQFFSAGGAALSSVISILPQSAPEYTVTGDGSSQTVRFSNVTPYITEDPFYARLNFSSAMTESGTWQNTMESMTTTLVTSVPEPSALLLLASGLAGLAGWRGRTGP